jgi:hypothetical protein
MTMNQRFTSPNTTVLEYHDAEFKSGPQPASDESMRHYISQWFYPDLRTGPERAAHLERVLALAREREQFCRGANDLFGLNRCLGNQALIQKARGKFEESLALLQQVETLSRRIDDGEGLAFALLHQASLLDT